MQILEQRYEILDTVIGEGLDFAVGVVDPEAIILWIKAECEIVQELLFDAEVARDESDGANGVTLYRNPDRHGSEITLKLRKNAT